MKPIKLSKQLLRKFSRLFSVIFILLYLSANTLFSQEALSETQTSDVIVNLSEFRNDSGVVRLALYDSAEGFPDKQEKAIKTKTSEINNTKATIFLKKIPYGTYAIGIYHDENSNSKMDFGFLRIPEEGYGASNNTRGTFGPPRFEEAKFEVNQETVNLEIKVIY